MAAVVAAARLFGQEAVLFADAGSYRTLLQRRLFKPTAAPTPAQALILAALLFPTAFYVNNALGQATHHRFLETMSWLALVQFAGLFVLVPMLVAAYLKIDIVRTFRLRPPPPLAWLAAMFVGLSSWVIAHEFVVLQAHVIPPSQALERASESLTAEIEAAPLALLILLFGLVPAVAEELLFRGFLLSGVRQGMRKWSSIGIAAAVFGVFHFLVDRMPVTALLGVVLGYLCWQCRSIWPGILAHALHNSSVVVLARMRGLTERLGIAGDDLDAAAHFPMRLVVPAAILFVVGLAIAAALRERPAAPASEPPSE
jgi:sodium transport system permease protein